MKKFLITLSLSALGVFVVTVGGGYWFLHRNHKPAPPTPAQLKSWQFQTPQITTNTKDGGLVQLQLTIQAGNQKSFADVSDVQSQIMDMINESIHQDSNTAFLNQQGLNAFKAQIQRGVEKILPNDSILAVDIDQIVEQSNG